MSELHEWEGYEFPVSRYYGWRCAKCHKMHAEMLSGSGLDKEVCVGGFPEEEGESSGVGVCGDPPNCPQIERAENEGMP